MRERSGKICDIIMEALLCSSYKYPCCDLFYRHVEEVLIRDGGYIETLVCTGKEWDILDHKEGSYIEENVECRDPHIEEW